MSLQYFKVLCISWIGSSQHPRHSSSGYDSAGASADIAGSGTQEVPPSSLTVE